MNHPATQRRAGNSLIWAQSCRKGGGGWCFTWHNGRGGAWLRSVGRIGHELVTTWVGRMGGDGLMWIQPDPVGKRIMAQMRRGHGPGSWGGKNPAL